MAEYYMDKCCEFCDFIENNSSLFKLQHIGYPWYYVARDLLFNSCFTTPSHKIDPIPFEDLNRDLESKLTLLNNTYDYAFVTRPKMRSLDPLVIENGIMIELMEYLSKQDKKFIVFEASEKDSRYDLKYLQSKFASVTLPVAPIVQRLTALNKTEIDSCSQEYRDKLEKLLSENKDIPSQYSPLVKKLKDIYVSLGINVIAPLLIFQALFQQLKIKAFFGAMGTTYIAGMDNEFCLVEVWHGCSGNFHDFPVCHVPVRNFHRNNLRIENNFCLQNGTCQKIIPQPDLYDDGNIFSFGMPGVRSYQPSPEREQALVTKFNLLGKKVVLFVTAGSMDYDQVNYLIEKIIVSFPEAIVLFRPHPHYGSPTFFDNYPNRLYLADVEDKHDLFRISDVVLTGQSSMVVEATCFTDDVIVLPPDNKYRYNREILQYKYPGTTVIPMYAIEEVINKIAACFSNPRRKDFKMEPVDYTTNLYHMLQSIETRAKDQARN